MNPFAGAAIDLDRNHPNQVWRIEFEYKAGAMRNRIKTALIDFGFKMGLRVEVHTLHKTLFYGWYRVTIRGPKDTIDMACESLDEFFKRYSA